MKVAASPVKSVSDTAFWVAYYRAVESKKKQPLFRDPLAELLTGEYGKKVSDSMTTFGQYAYWSVTIRTRIIDDFIEKYIKQGYKTIINLGAGLDTRPYRLNFPAGMQWIEIDLPHVVALKNEKLKNHIPNCNLQRVGLDLSDQVARSRLFSELNHSTGPALILTEGIIPYLAEDSVKSLANDIKDQSNFKLWLAEYYSPEVYPRYQSRKFRASLGDAPFLFFPENWFTFFANCGWAEKELKYLYDEAQKHNRRFPLPWWARILRVLIGEKNILKGVRKFSAYIVFEKIADKSAAR